MAKKENGELKFEKGLEKLEEVVEALEGGDIDLETALKKFETGIKLTKDLQVRLEASQRKVKKLLAGEDGPVEEDLDASPSEKKGNQDTLF